MIKRPTNKKITSIIFRMKPVLLVKYPVTAKRASIIKNILETGFLSPIRYHPAHSLQNS
jgi:hypothetical protein